jgi:hypothetical protein
MKNKKNTNEGIIDSAKKFSDNFFDGLKVGAVNRALAQAEKNPKLPPPIVQRMRAIDKLAKELEKDLQYYS